MLPDSRRLAGSHRGDSLAREKTPVKKVFVARVKKIDAGE